METFSELLAICAGNTPVTGEFPAQRRVTRSFDVFFDLRLNKWLSKQSWDWWFETLSRPLWRHCHGIWRHGGDHIRMYTGPTFEGLTWLCCWYKMLKAKKPTMICCVLSRLICQSLLCHHISVYMIWKPLYFLVFYIGTIWWFTHWGLLTHIWGN